MAGIVTLKNKAGYMKARTLAAEKGRLPSNVLHDECFRSDRWKTMGGLYPAWARQFIVHPEKGGKFTPGEDVVDSETGWLVPGYYLLNGLSRDVFREGAALFIDPLEITNPIGRTVITPGLIVVLDHFIQESGRMGAVDERTRIPLAVQPQNGQKQGWLYRIDGVGVRPIACAPDDAGRSIVNIDISPVRCLGVAAEPAG